ncbi:MAG TPA: DUF192 domain-containing protein [Leptolinea sp.]
MKSLLVQNLSLSGSVPIILGICDNFSSRFRGLMFYKTIPQNGGLFFINSTEDRVNSAIHMFFMKFDLTIIWVDSTNRVVDKIKARKWQTLAAPRKGAKFILETHIDRFDEYHLGDILEFCYE